MSKHTVLFELGCEELPPKSLKKLRDALQAETVKGLKDAGLALEVTEKAKSELVKEGYDFQYGARPLRRSIQKLVEDPIAELMLRREATTGDTVRVDADEAGKLTFGKKE